MAKTELISNLVRRIMGPAPVKRPQGVRLTSEETSELITVWKKDKATISANNYKLEGADEQIQRVIEYKLPDALVNVGKARTEAIRYFKITNDPIKRAEWGRRLVVAERSLQAIKGSEKRMLAMSQRIKGLVADAALEKQALEIRIGEAEAYVAMGQGLRLVGQTLVDARQRAASAEVEFETLELGIEDIESVVKGDEDDDIILEAERIVGIKKKQTQ